MVDSGDVKLRGNVLFSSLTYFDSLRQGLTIGGGESSLSLFSFLFRAVKDVGWWCTRFFILEHQTKLIPAYTRTHRGTK